ncbi:P-loop containing nucleoside triphosphate hydrolase protein [Xylaria sp. FL1042]|nr:P-loop containing nucleoside triphosphate hydrolase protein [Xylaria sp. FL1042]
MAAPAASATRFVPRTVFEVSPSIIRSYFLGHHKAGLRSMREILSNIGLILECRDSRVPLTSANPLLESALAGRDRIIVYTKTDLSPIPQSMRRLLENPTPPPPSSSSSLFLSLAVGAGAVEGVDKTHMVFTQENNPRTMKPLLHLIKKRAEAHDSLLGLRALVVGMPNAGKSSLLNALRREGMKLPGAAQTGSNPGVTRKLSTPVRIIPAASSSDKPTATADDNDNENSNDNYRDVGAGEGVYVLDTPGVFIPYVSDAESMLKLCLVGCVKDGVVPFETLADYLLFLLNNREPALYAKLSEPTNDVDEFLDNIARRTGKLLKGGVPAREQAADWVVKQWRKGELGRFGLDDLSKEGLEARARRLAREGGANAPLSMNQARKREKEARKARNAAKRAAALDPGS